MVSNNFGVSYPNLKKRIIANNIALFTQGHYQSWKIENIADGLKKFFHERGRYPTVHEIDDLDYLPTSRQIQRAFGGLVKLRQKLGLTITDYTTGACRSDIGNMAWNRALTGLKIEAFLVNLNFENWQNNAALLSSYLKNKKNPLDANVKVVSKVDFLEFIEAVEPIKHYKKT